MKVTLEIDITVQGGHSLLIEDVQRHLATAIRDTAIDYYDPSLGEYIFATLEAENIREAER